MRKNSWSDEAVQVLSAHVEAMNEKQSEDKQSNELPDMRIVGPWSDVVTNLNYIQDPPSWHGLSSSNVMVTKDVLNS